MPRKKRAPQKQTLPIPLLLAIGGGVLLIITAILVAGGNNPPAAGIPTTAPDIQADIPYPEVERVSLTDAKAALDSGSTVFIDVRGDEVYAISHVRGALSIPLGELETRLGELDPEQRIITYCT
jgi:hypothetical protein